MAIGTAPRRPAKAENVFSGAWKGERYRVIKVINSRLTIVIRKTTRAYHLRGQISWGKTTSPRQISKISSEALLMIVNSETMRQSILLELPITQPIT